MELEQFASIVRYYGVSNGLLGMPLPRDPVQTTALWHVKEAGHDNLIIL
jgi:hypothetical protein